MFVCHCVGMPIFGEERIEFLAMGLFVLAFAHARLGRTRHPAHFRCPAEQIINPASQLVVLGDGRQLVPPLPLVLALGIAAARRSRTRQTQTPRGTAYYR